MKTKTGPSDIHGRGVFATQDLAAGEVIEVCELIILSRQDTARIDETVLYEYYFAWEDEGAFALGHGSLYNHSYTPNAQYERSFSDETITFRALEPIQAGREITINYNGDPRSKKSVWFD